MGAEILILGANGQLGSDLVRVLSVQQLNFISLTRPEFDVLKDDLAAKLVGHNFKYIINCIATTNVDGCEDDPDVAFCINSSFAYKLARLCKHQDITLFHISTDYVFDGLSSSPYTEDDQPKPLNIYGLSKYAGELAIQAYHTKSFIFRVSSLFGKAGASGKGGNFITTMQRLGRERESVSVIANQITCPTSTLEIAKCISYFMANQIQDYGIYNCVSTNSCSWFEFAQAIFCHSNLDSQKVQPADFATYAFKACRPQYAVLTTDKLAKYYRMPTWQASLAAYFLPN
jgi:dTDP-4-dehydrorhamnose reductase